MEVIWEIFVQFTYILGPIILCMIYWFSGRKTLQYEINLDVLQKLKFHNNYYPYRPNL